jgi:hypothetical protein
VRVMIVSFFRVPPVVQVFQEVVLGIKVVKAYGWESSFLDKVMAIRKRESAAQLSLAYLQAIVIPISLVMPIAAITATFAVRVAVEGPCVGLPSGCQCMHLIAVMCCTLPRQNHHTCAIYFLFLAQVICLGMARVSPR